MYSTDYVQEFLAWYSEKHALVTIRQYGFAIRKFESFIDAKGISIIDCDLADVLRYSSILKEDGLASASRALYLNAVKTCLKYLSRRHQLRFDPKDIEIPRAESVSHPPVEDHDKKNIMESFDPTEPHAIRDRAVISMYSATAIRLNELGSRNLTHLDLDRLRLRVRTLKRHGVHERIVYFDRKTRQYMKEWLAVREEFLRRYPGGEQDAIFITLRPPSRRLSGEQLQKVMRRKRKELGIETPITAHSWRHRFGHQWIKKNLNLRYLQDFLGHAKIQSTMVYTKAHAPEIEMVYRHSFESNAWSLLTHPSTWLTKALGEGKLSSYAFTGKNQTQ